jgi:uncharacterized damage-inducible protein DinB
LNSTTARLGKHLLWHRPLWDSLVEAETAIDWAMKKMEEEKEARAMAEQYPAVADALNAVWESEQQLKTIVALCRT